MSSRSLDFSKWLDAPSRLAVAVSDGRGNGLYQHEVCNVGTCLRPPGHSGRHDQFDGPQSADSVPLHPLKPSTEKKMTLPKKKLLDHGYLELIETWGSDQRIVESARMSTAKGFLGWGPLEQDCNLCQGRGSFMSTVDDRDSGSPCSACKGTGKQPGDEKLLRFLWEHKHSTPFEFAGLTIEVKAPIMVFREWHRHRVPFGYNEMSARYVPLPDENYSPTVGRIVEGARSAGKNKQAQAAVDAVISDKDALVWLSELAGVYEHAQKVYLLGLGLGVPKELARLPVPVARYSRMRATANLRGWLAFMTLRSAPAAQYEIRVYADAVGELLAERFPRTWELFTEGQHP